MLAAMRLPLPSFCAWGVFALVSTACVASDDVNLETTGQPATAETNDSTMTTPPTTGPTGTSQASVDPSTDDTIGPEDTTTTANPTTTTTTTSSGPPQVVMETTLGTIVIELDDVAAPITVDNFLAYVDSGFFDGTDGQGATIFHRVIPDFVVQGGGLTEDEQVKATMPPIVNESGNGLTNVRGSIAMARTMDPDSATSQFYFNLVDNPLLDEPPGYAVFGIIVEGLDVMDAIGAVEVDAFDVPLEPVFITAVSVQ